MSLVGYSPKGHKRPFDWATEHKPWAHSNEWVTSLSCVRLFLTPWTVACWDSLSMEFFRQEYCSGLPFPSPGHLPHPGIKYRSPLRADSLPSEPSGTTSNLPWFMDLTFQVPMQHCSLQHQIYLSPDISTAEYRFCFSPVTTFLLESEVKVKSLRHVWLFLTQWTVAC